MFVGHSLGGGLASLASAATGCYAIVFNPAAYAELWNDALNSTGKYYGTSKIYAYIMDNDPVTCWQNRFGVYAPGNIIKVWNCTGGDSHEIRTMVINLK